MWLSGGGRGLKANARHTFQICIIFFKFILILSLQYYIKSHQNTFVVQAISMWLNIKAFIYETKIKTPFLDLCVILMII